MDTKATSKTFVDMLESATDVADAGQELIAQRIETTVDGLIAAMGLLWENVHEALEARRATVAG